MRANPLLSPMPAPEVVFLDTESARAPSERSPLSMRACLAAWGCLAVASWAVVVVVGSQFI